jgi:2-polyprenyl-3-methyl-5-hydroxy-6-metoxy-1,4-benzoquinol methylase
VIAYAACVGNPHKFQSICLPGLKRVVGPDDVLIEAEHPQSIFAAYNEVLDAVRDRDDLEALVLLHEDTEVTDEEFADIVRERLAEPGVEVVGAVGARDLRGLAWWEAVRTGKINETYGLLDFGGGTHDVDTVDGLVMALSPWAVRNLRFDEETYSGFDAYDADFCAQVRAAGKRVVVTELPVVHRHTRVGDVRANSDGDSFGRNDAIFRSKWLTGLEVVPAPRTRMVETNSGYFGLTRPEVRALVPESARRVLDVGCGAGGLGGTLKAERGCEVFGLELFPDAAETARERLDSVLCVDLDTLEELPEEMQGLDAIVFGDVLEHLRDPARLLRALLPALADDGVLVLSVPNVKHWSVILPLLANDRWTYEDAGLLDRTHVHFFTAYEATRMLAELGLEVTHLEVNDHAPLPVGLVTLAAVAQDLGGWLPEAAARLGSYQYLMVARRAAPGHAIAPTTAEQPEVPQTSTREEVLALVPESARRVLEIGADTTLEAPEGEPGAYDAIVLRDALEHVTDPAGLLRALLPSLADDGVFVCAVPNVRHWSVLQPLLAHDRWDYRDDGILDRRHLYFFTLEELGDLLDELELDAVELVPNDSAPLPPEMSKLLEMAVAAGAEREETALRLGAHEYLLVVRRRR